MGLLLFRCHQLAVLSPGGRNVDDDVACPLVSTDMADEADVDFERLGLGLPRLHLDILRGCIHSVLRRRYIFEPLQLANEFGFQERAHDATTSVAGVVAADQDRGTR